jgi:hypothetical protein
VGKIRTNKERIKKAIQQAVKSSKLIEIVVQGMLEKNSEDVVVEDMKNIKHEVDEYLKIFNI